MSEDLAKKLEKNYGKLQKKEVSYNEKADKILSKYDSNLKKIAANLKTEHKAQAKTEKEVKQEHKALLKDTKDKHKEDSQSVKKRIKEAKDLYKDECSKADDIHVKAVTKNQGLTEKANNEHAKLVEKEQKAFDKDLAAIEKEKNEIVADFEAKTEKAIAAFVEKKEKYDEKVATINEKRDSKIESITEKTEKKNIKLEESIQKEREKSDKQLEELKPIYEEKIASLDEMVEKEKLDVSEKENSIQTTLDEKISRRNKFLEQAERQGDSKSAKIHRKEIKKLQQNADRELKTLQQGLASRLKDFEAKRKEIKKNNLEQIAAVEREFTNFKEDALMQIEVNKATLSDEITKLKLDTELKLLDELDKFNKLEAKHTVALAQLVKDKDLAVQAQDNAKVKRTIEFEKTNEVNAQKLAQELAKLQKELTVIHYEKEQAYALALNKQNVSLEELASEQDLLDRKLDQDIVLNEEEESLKVINNDLLSQNSIKEDFFDAQNEHIALMQQRSQELLDYEEFEIDTRFNKKAAFLQEQLDRVQNDFENLNAKIEESYANELAFFEGQIAAVEKAETALVNKELKAIEKQQEETQALLDEASEANLPELQETLKTLDQEKVALLAKVEQNVAAKTDLFHKNIELAKLRKEKALTEASEVYEFEQNDIKYASELVSQNKEAELQEVRARQAKTLQNSNNFSNKVVSRHQQLLEENTALKQERTDRENAAIQETKQAFETDKNNRLSEKDAKLQQLEADKQEAIANFDKAVSEAEALLESKTNEFQANITSAENKALDALNAETKANNSTVSSIEQAFIKVETDVEVEQNRKDSEYKIAVQQIDNKQGVETKQFEEALKRIQKEYEIELKKGITAINKQLDLDIKQL